MDANEKTPVVLIIDADSASRNFLDLTLRKNGYTVLTAPLGREGLITAWKDLPDIILIDPSLPDISGMDLITKLRQDQRTATQPCIALCGQDKQAEVAEYLLAGFNETLIKSNRTIQDLLVLIPRLFQEESKARRNGTLLVFLSAKGGTGTSSLCANIAMCTGAIDSQARVVVVDMVLPIGSIANIVGYNGQVNITSLAARPPESLTPVYFKSELPNFPAWKFSLVAGSPDPECAGNLVVSCIPKIISTLQEIYDYVFIDLGRSLSRISMPIIKKADLVALIVSTDLSSVTLTRIVRDYLQIQGLDNRHLYLILNRAVGLEGITKAEAEKAIGLEIQMTMPYMGGNFTLANNHHEPVANRFPSDSATLMLEQASRQLVEQSDRLRAQ